MAGALALGLLVGGEPASAGPPDPGAGARVVTLVTGDRVALTRAGQVMFLPTEGRERAEFSVTRHDDHVYVVPSDAQRLVATGRLDRRLFDVAGLVRQGYGDNRRSSIPLIVSYAASRATPLSGVRNLRPLRAIGGAQLTVAKPDAAAFFAQAPKLARVWLDGRREVSLADSVPRIGAPAAWRAGYTGKDVRVAVLDTGVDDRHPDLAGRVAAARDFTGAGPADTVGHGTHVASTIAGKHGVAPDAALLSGKVCAGRFCDDSAILAGMEWAAAEQRATVVNLSLGGDDLPGIDPLEQAVNTLTAQTGTLFVVAAGNDGVVASPGSAEAALTVGAVDEQDVLADFSGRGPGVGDHGLKPDLTAPGVSIVAARAAGTSMGTPVSELHTRADGTSMATPHVAGTAALLAQRHAAWRAGELKAALVGSAQPVAGSTAYEQGAGRVDAGRAIGQTMVATTPSLSFGLQQWPHEDDKPDARQLSYRNHGDQDIELALSTEFTGPDGSAAAEGALTLSARTLRVPAGGSVSVTVTSDTRVAGPVGAYSGRVIATAGDSRTVTPVGVVREAENHSLTIRHLDRQGNPAIGFDLLKGLDVEGFHDVLSGEDGVTRLRLPKGRYVLTAQILQDDLLVQPTVTMDRDVTITADARTARPLRVEVERESARLMTYEVGFLRDCTGCGSFAFGLAGFRMDTLRTAQLGDAAPAGEFTATLQTHWGEPGPMHDFTNSPYLYGLMTQQDGRFYTGTDQRARDAELARVTSTFVAQRPGQQGAFVSMGSLPAGGVSTGIGVSYDLPHQVTRLHSGNGIRWAGHFLELGDEFGTTLSEQTVISRTYQSGKAYADRWNGAVFGPGFSAWSRARRDADRMSVGISLFADAAADWADSEIDAAATKLYRDGQLVAESDWDGSVSAEGLPDQPAEYRLETTARRDSTATLSTRVDAAWTFRSARADQQMLPLWAVRFRPRLDGFNTGSPEWVPVRLQAQPGAEVGRPERLSVSVSGDDGASWRPAPLVRVGTDRWFARITAPAGSAYVSLRAEAVDNEGNAVRQTMIRAYRLGPS